MSQNEAHPDVTPAVPSLEGLATAYLPPPQGCSAIPCAKHIMVKEMGTCSIQVQGVERQWEEGLQVEGVG